MPSLRSLLGSYSKDASRWLQDHPAAQPDGVQGDGDMKVVPFRDPRTGEYMIVTTDRNGNPKYVDFSAE